jgi:hypothetical protein
VLVAALVQFFAFDVLGFYWMAIIGNLLVILPVFNYLFARGRFKKLMLWVAAYMVLASAAIYVDVAITRRAIDHACQEAYSQSSFNVDDGQLLCRGYVESEGFAVNMQTVTMPVTVPMIVLLPLTLLATPLIGGQALIRRVKSKT